MPTKADYVRAQPVDHSDPHTCHAEGCQRTVKPSLFMCREHWRMVPPALQQRIWRHFRPGQEKDKRASTQYLDAARESVAAVKEFEDRLEKRHAREGLRQGKLL